jgi:DNA-directed RNA polymerase specialized sigma24 family protein
MIARAHTDRDTGWSEVATRKLLRKLHIPAALDEDPIAQQIAATSNTTSPRAAVYALVKRTLQPYPDVYRTVIQRMDVDGASTATIAAELRCSPRSVFRYRACAMAAIRRAIDETLREIARAERSGRWQMSRHRPVAVERSTAV